MCDIKCPHITVNGAIACNFLIIVLKNRLCEIEQRPYAHEV